MQSDERLIVLIRFGLRDELSAIQPPDDALPRLRERIARDLASADDRGVGSRRHSLATVILVAASSLIAIVIAGVALVAFRTGPQSNSTDTSHWAVKPFTMRVPRSYVALSESAVGGNQVVERVPIATGGFVPTAGDVEAINAGYGTALLPNGRDLFYVSTPGNAVKLMRVNLVTGVQTVMVPWGVDPAVSPDGQWLAYASQHDPDLRVRDLATGETRKINLAKVFGHYPAPTVTWLDDGTDIAVADQGFCKELQKTETAACLAIVHVGADGLTARRFIIQAPGRFGEKADIAISGDTAQPRSMILALSGQLITHGLSAGPFWTGIYRVALGGSSVSLTKLGMVRGFVAEGIDPSGHELIVSRGPLDGSGQAIVTIDGTHLTPPRRLRGNPPTELAW